MVLLLKTSSKKPQGSFLLKMISFFAIKREEPRASAPPVRHEPASITHCLCERAEKAHWTARTTLTAIKTNLIPFQIQWQSRSMALRSASCMTTRHLSPATPVSCYRLLHDIAALKQFKCYLKLPPQCGFSHFCQSGTSRDCSHCKRPSGFSVG